MKTALDYLQLDYKTIDQINGPHGIYLVKHRINKRIFVMKMIRTYTAEVYHYLLDHPVKGIPYIYEIYCDHDLILLIEEYIHGSTFQERLDTHTLTPAEIKDYMIQLCRVLGPLHAHRPPLIHRDIKPDNIMISRCGCLSLLDFDAAKFISNVKERPSDTRLLGTPGYAAPEQYGFRESSPQSDVYSIGCVLKEAVDSLPYADHTFDLVIDKCLQLDPSRRYSTADDLRIALLRCHPVCDPSFTPASILKR